MNMREPSFDLSARSRWADGLGRLILYMAAAVFIPLFLISLVSTCKIDLFFSADNNEHVSFVVDNLLLNLAVLAAMLGLSFVALRASFKKSHVRTITGILLFASTGIGIWWVLSTRSVPRADAKFITDAALELARGVAPGDVFKATDYFQKYPFQLGYLRYAETVCRLFGPEHGYTALSVLNVILVDVAYLAVLSITDQLFSEEKIRSFTALLLLLCMQPVFLCTFLYGVLPGLGPGLWGVSMAIRYIREDKKRYLAAAGLLLAVGYVLKMNYILLIIAVSVALFIHMLRSKRWMPLVGIIMIAGMALLLNTAVVKSYERRGDTTFGKGTPLTAHLVMGMSESSMCSGWYTGYAGRILPESGYDQQVMRETIKEDLREELNKFAGRPRYLLSFMYHKLVSQWNEPSFQCIWSSASGEHSGPLSPFVESMLTGNGERALHQYFDFVVQFVYLSFAVGLLALAKKGNRPGEGVLILPLVILGAFLYHGLFEAKSQYALVYLPMMLPYGAYGLSALAALPKKIHTKKDLLV